MKGSRKESRVKFIHQVFRSLRAYGMQTIPCGNQESIKRGAPPDCLDGVREIHVDRFSFLSGAKQLQITITDDRQDCWPFAEFEEIDIREELEFLRQVNLPTTSVNQRINIPERASDQELVAAIKRNAIELFTSPFPFDNCFSRCQVKEVEFAVEVCGR